MGGTYGSGIYIFYSCVSVTANCGIPYRTVGGVVLSWILTSATSRDIVSVGLSMFIRYIWLTSFGVKTMLNDVLFLT